MTSRWVAIILAAGHGTRMRSSVPKVAHPLAGRAVVRHVVQAARDAGVDDCVVVVGPDDDAGVVRDAAGDVRFTVQAEPLGTAHAVEAARDAVGDAEYALIMSGDVPLVLPETLRRLMAVVELLDDGGPDLAVLTAEVPLEAYGFLEMEGDRITAIIETKGEAEIDRAEPRYINSGQYAARASWLWTQLPLVAPAANGERYLTQLARLAREGGNPALAVVATERDEVRGINDRAQLAEAEAIMRARINRRHMLAGVTIVDPGTTYVDAGVKIGSDATLEPNTHLRGNSDVGRGCIIGPGAFLSDATLGDECAIRMSMIEQSVLASHVHIGPYSHIRPGSQLGEGVHIGNYAEVKASRLGRNTKMGHFSYIGDADVGDDVNIGAGTITANYDGVSKHRTVIGDGAFIGSDTMLIAPVRIGRGAATSAGSVVNRDVPDGMLAVGAPARIRARRGAARPIGEPQPRQEESGPG